MAGLGEILRAEREKKGLTLDAIADETNIAKRYLNAFENDDFSPFPAEAYMLGFLKNYGEYLGLDTAALINMYRNIKIQEEPVPVEALLKHKINKAAIIVPVALLLVFGGGGGIYFYNKTHPKEAPPEKEVRKAVDYTMQDGLLENRFYEGDSVVVEAGERSYKMSIGELADVLTINAPEGPVRLELSQTARLDLDGDGKDDIEISLEDYARNEPSMGAWLRFTLGASTPYTSAVQNASSDSVTNIFTSTSSYPFTLQVRFQGYCMFRWEVLRERDKQGRHEQYYSAGGDLTISAQNGVRIWASNAAAFETQVTGGGRTQSFKLGEAGEVVVADIAWVRDSSEGSWKLAVLRLEN